MGFQPLTRAVASMLLACRCFAKCFGSVSTIISTLWPDTFQEYSIWCLTSYHALRQLLDMYFFVSLGSQFDRSCWAAIIFSFRTLLRKSHILPDSSGVNPHLICRSDIEFCPDGVLVKVRTSKTDRSGGKPFKIMIYKTDQQPLCAASWTRTHFTQTPSPEEGLFVKLVKDKYVPLMYRDVLDYLKKLVQLIGLDPDEAGLHSLRRSGASYLNSIGVPLPDIKLLGNWRSSAVFEYIKSTDVHLSAIQRSVAESLNYV